MPRDRDDETGKYEEVYTEAAVREVLDGARLATTEVADALGCHRTTAHDRLTELESEGLVSATEAGQTYLWEWTGSNK